MKGSKLRWPGLIFVTAFILCMVFVPSDKGPLQVRAASRTAVKGSQKGRSASRRRRYFSSSKGQLVWDNRYLFAVKKTDLSAFVKGAAGLSRKDRARLIRWKVSAPSVLTINRYGVARAKKAGTCRVTCRVRAARGWKKSSVLIRVFDPRKVTFHISLSLDPGNPYASKVQKSYNSVFDTATVRIRNTTRHPVRLGKKVLLHLPECSYVPNRDRQGCDVWMYSTSERPVSVKAGKTLTIRYKTSGAVSYLKENQKTDNTALIIPFVSDGTRKELRYEMPAMKCMVTR